MRSRTRSRATSRRPAPTSGYEPKTRARRRHAGQRALVRRAGGADLVGRSILVTGGSGYFGEILASGAVAGGDRVRIFDVNPPATTAAAVEYVQGDVRDREAVRAACDGRRRGPAQRRAGAAGARPRALPVGQRGRHREPPCRRARRRCRQGRAHVVERGVRDPGREPGHRGDTLPSPRVVRTGQARGRGAVSRGGRVRSRRHHHPAPHDPRSRATRDLRRAVRVRRRRRARVRPRRGRQPVPVRPRRRPRRRVPPGRRP